MCGWAHYHALHKEIHFIEKTREDRSEERRVGKECQP